MLKVSLNESFVKQLTNDYYKATESVKRLGSGSTGVVSSFFIPYKRKNGQMFILFYDNDFDITIEGFNTDALPELIEDGFYTATSAKEIHYTENQ